jgi:Nucleoside-diphosphate-sugar epimerases
LKALITGASGFVGKTMTKKLLSHGVEVLGISRSVSELNGEATEKYQCDVQQKTKLKEILHFYRPDYIVHLAGPAFIPDSINKPETTYNVIFQGTLNLLESIRELELSAKLLYISSADVYGANSKSFLSEQDSIEPNNPYSSAKACAELACKQYFHSYGMDIMIARPFNHTGPGQSSDFVCSNFALQIASMRNGTSCRLMTGNIDVERDFLDVRDVVEAYFELLKSGKSGEIYNICSNQAISIRSIIEMLFRVADIEDYTIEVNNDRVRKNEISLRVGDNSKIMNTTNWSPQYTMNQTVTDLFKYWKENMHVG